MADSIFKIKETCTPELMACEGIEGVGMGEHEGKESIVIYTSEISEMTKEKVKVLLKNTPHRFEKTGSFNAL